jgi:trimeric autotransporter adhesin
LLTNSAQYFTAGKKAILERKHLARNFQVGFIAQDLQKVLPEVVDVGEDSYRSVQYGKIVTVVVAAVKELYNKYLGHDKQLLTQARIIASKADKAEVDALKAENAKLKQENAAIRYYLCGKDPTATICK